MIRYRRSTRYGIAIVTFSAGRADAEVPGGPHAWSFGSDPERTIVAAIARLR